MAFELAAIDPTSVPINLLNPRPGTKFGDRQLIDPWEAVKWVAIFRLILPEALFRLCGGRVENLRELQPLAVKAGLNGVMMGNFLTTLGAEPEQDRTMFEMRGLNVARQHDNAANPRPDNRSGWLSGETPDVVGALLADPPRPDAGERSGEGHERDLPEEDAAGELRVRLWDPSAQLRYRAKPRTPVAGWGD
jgi:biotin synthase